MKLKEALKIFGDIQLEFPTHPHLRVCKNIKDVQDAYKVIEQALTELEFYKSFPQLQEASLIPEVNLKLVTCELQLRELKCYVKRYFDLGHIEEPSTEQFEEYLKLTEKLLKVGKEE